MKKMLKRVLAGVLAVLLMLPMASNLSRESEVNAASAGLSQGSYGFFKSRGSSDALKVLDWGISEEGSTNLSASYDATNLDLMLQSLDWIDECNQLRANHGLPALLVSDYMMAVAQVQLNWSDSNTGHSRFYNVGENLAWNYRDPFDGWYTKEKQMYDAGNTNFSQVGHYLNIIDEGYAVTGFAVSKDSSGGWSVSYGQTFSFDGDVESANAQTVDAYRNDLKAYIASGGINAEEIVEKVDETTPLDATPVPMYRLYNPNSGEHFYTAAAGEKDNLVSVGWQYEGLGWTAPTKSNTPVYRLYNPNAGDHHYTMNYAEAINLVNVGWNYEGIGWYSDTNNTTPLYRQYNANAVAGSHNYTTNIEENDFLVSNGWSPEGIAWYGL